MKPIRHSLVPDRSHGRTPAVQLLIDETNALIREAARFYPGCGDREIARRLRSALSMYSCGRWRRDQACEVCPMQHRGKLLQIMWLILKVRDRVPSEPAIRRALG
ncbi:hypothetical protein [Bradyrhizobium japonicum]|uniref:hypothetical protein n=1 Tax=Bradyrhizobium japonicum TaxID=375 RepID=UPI001E2EF068|nr:hypothetical protein [Bradyrhizobium japonicum]MCD9821624.1 hypothetical protein [Bradyrhizobium japonicum]MEB2678417.1 hypothetical protein [Bradyrhizobium japonicum]WRI88653.1 hypothetical protein R3F75_43675 [Bradyrhizobium japonicum]